MPWHPRQGTTRKVTPVMKLLKEFLVAAACFVVVGVGFFIVKGTPEWWTN